MTGRVAIFGGSGRLGEVIVRHMAEQRPVRFAYFSNEARAAALVDELRGQGRDVGASRVDVSDQGDVRAFLESAAEGDGLGAVISANGSFYQPAPLHEVDDAEFRRVIELDVFGSFNIMKAATPILARGGGGAIVLLLTAAMIRTVANNTLSHVPKAAVTSMIRQLARDAGPINVRVNGIAPAVTNTDKAMDVASMPPVRRTLIESVIADTPLPRLNNPQMIAALAAFLTSDVAADISGQIIGADGGYSA